MSAIDPEALGLGLDTFGDVTRDAAGELVSDAQTIRNVVDQAVLADEVGLVVLRGGGASPSRVRDLEPRDRPRRRGRAHDAASTSEPR